MNTEIETMPANGAITAVINELPLPAYVKALPLALQEVGRAAATLETRIIGLEREHAARCAAVAADVLDRKDEATGKPVASNDTARKALIEQETAADGECRRLLADLDGLKRERTLALADVEALRVAARLIGATVGQGTERI